MRSISQVILEKRAPKPSDLSKFKHGSETRINTYVVGDIYDLSNGDSYEQEDKYYRGDGDGYIMDKNGNVYDLSVSEGTEDAGRIAGGTTTKSVCIRRVGPTGQDIILSGYSVVFSRPTSETFWSLISDIKAGMYLEDYLKEHEHDISYQTRKEDWIRKLIDAGSEYTTYEKQKQQRKDEKYNSFGERFIAIKPDDYLYDCVGGTTLKIAERQMRQIDGGWRRYGAIATIKQTDSDKIVLPSKTISDAIEGSIKEMAEKILSNNLGGYDCKGLTFSFAFSWEGKVRYGNDNESPTLAWDAKESKFVVVLRGKRKVLDRKYELRLGGAVRTYGEVSKSMEKILNDISRAQIKSLGTQTEYIKKHYRDLAWGHGYWQAEHSMAEGKEMAKCEFEKLKSQHEYRPGSKNFCFTISELTSVLGTGKYDKFKVVQQSTAKDVPADDVTPEINDGSVKPESRSAAEIYGKAYIPAKEKMEKWHNGERKQNLKSCSDVKLRMNYAICKELGYDEEMALIKAEASSRGIVLESKTILTLSDYIWLNLL